MKNIFWIIPFVWAIYSQFGSFAEPERLVILDIGQGDATIIQSAGITLLVDGGIGRDTTFQLDRYLDLSDRYIDYLVLTHNHADHYGGVEEIIERFPIGEFWLSKGCETENLRIIKLLETRGIYVRAVGQGDVFELGNVIIEILSPSDRFFCGIEKNLNNTSITMEVTAQHHTVFLMGDAESEVERDLLRWMGSRNDLKVTSNAARPKESVVLKAGHHCSKTSSTIEWLTFVDPDQIVCSAGRDNRFGHPSREVIQRFNRLGIPYHVTFSKGDYLINFDP